MFRLVSKFWKHAPQWDIAAVFKILPIQRPHTINNPPPSQYTKRDRPLFRYPENKSAPRGADSSLHSQLVTAYPAATRLAMCASASST